MDLTLLSKNTGTLWTRYLRRNGELPLKGLLRVSWWILLYRFALLDYERAAALVTSSMAGELEDDLRQKTRAWVHKEVAGFIRPGARRRIQEHKNAGESCAILSSATPYATEPLAELLEIPHVVCSRLEVAEGRFTGRNISPMCYGPGKIVWAERFATQQGVKLADCAFYTDSYTDVPMLERVGRPVVINPDLRLAREAKKRGWPVEDWQA